jgi:hypothetical protein
MRVTHGMQSNYGGSTHRRHKVIKNLLGYDPLNPEHEATGQVLWVNLTNMYKYFAFHSGAQPLELHEIILTSY